LGYKNLSRITTGDQTIDILMTEIQQGSLMLNSLLRKVFAVVIVHQEGKRKQPKPKSVLEFWGSKCPPNFGGTMRKINLRKQ
jgi:hypothetical protein